MKEPNTIFQNISIRRRVNIAMGMFTVLIVVVGLYSLIAILETNKRLHKSVLEGEVMANAIDTARVAEVHFKKQVQEWKNILLRGNDGALFDKYLSAFNEEDRKVNEALKSLSQIVSSTGMTVPQIADTIKVHEELGRQYRDALKNYKQSDLKSAVLVDQSVRGIDRAPTDEIDAIVAAIKTQAETRLKETEQVAKIKLEAYQSFSFFLIFLVIAGVCFGIFNAWSINRDLPPEESENNSKTEEM